MLFWIQTPRFPAGVFLAPEIPFKWSTSQRNITDDRFTAKWRSVVESEHFQKNLEQYQDTMEGNHSISFYDLKSLIEFHLESICFRYMDQIVKVSK